MTQVRDAWGQPEDIYHFHPLCDSLEERDRSPDLAGLRQCDGAVAQAGGVVAIRRATDDMLGAHACLGRGA